MTVPASERSGRNRPTLDPDRPWSGVDAASARYVHDNRDQRVIAQRGTGAAVRTIIDLLKDTKLSTAQLDTVTDHLQRAIEELRHVESMTIDEPIDEPVGDIGRGPHPMIEFSPVTGRTNPLSVLMHYSATPERLIAEFSYTAAYEGPPGCAHGGFIAAAFDEVLSVVAYLVGKPAVTGKLAIDYHAPTPLHRPLRIEAWLDHTSGRRVSVKATLRDGDRLCAKASALYVALDVGTAVSLLDRVQP